MKKCLIFIFLMCALSFRCFASTNNIHEIYSEQLKFSGAEKLIDSIPPSVAKSLENIGINGKNLIDTTKITLPKVFNEILGQIKIKSKNPLKAVVPTIGVILLCAMIDIIDLSLGTVNMSEIMSAIGSICICICIINPIVSFIVSSSIIIKSVSGFIMCFIPIMAGIMIMSGQTVTASSYQITMTFAGQVITELCTNILVQLMSTMLGISVISSISLKLHLENLCDLIYKIVKWCLWTSTTIFTALLALQNLVSVPADNIGGKAAKLALSSFVPIVGGALGDAFNTVYSCIKLLKSGVGVLAVLAGGMMFLPLITECCIWIVLLSICSSISDILIPHRLSVLFMSTCKVMKTMLAIIFSCITVLIISTGIVLMIGSGT